MADIKINLGGIRVIINNLGGMAVILPIKIFISLFYKEFELLLNIRTSTHVCALKIRPRG